ncbi:MAG: PAN domain-containing protein [Robiginitomaculum sp.]
MSRFTSFALISGLVSGLVFGMAPFLTFDAQAADQSTYRPGKPYLKIAATSPWQCKQQCQGDAQCRGWNFVRVNVQARSGICEFNSEIATPVSSPISISGQSTTDIDRLMSRAVAAGAHTVRVGTPVVTHPKPSSVPQRSVQQSSRRIVRRQPISAPRAQLKRAPMRRNMQAFAPVFANYKLPQPVSPQTRVIDPRKPRIYGNPQQQPLPPGQKSVTQAELQRQQQRQMMLRAQQAAALRTPMDRPLNMQRQMRLHPQPKQASRQQRAPLAHMLPQRQMPAPIPRPDIATAKQQSLYGNLHDDLTKMTSVPRLQTAPDNLKNPDVPVSTSRAVPSKPVTQEPLDFLALPPLAGG